MTSAEVTLETKTSLGANKKIVFVTGTGVNAADYISFTGLTQVTFALMQFYNSATVASYTIATNRVTFANVNGKVVYGVVVGDGGIVSTS